MNNISIKDLVRYIIDSIDIIVTIKTEEKLNLYKNNYDSAEYAKDLEILLQKEENAIRQHISIEHQFRIQCEKFAKKIDMLENEKIKIINEVVRYIYYKSKIIYL